jgi:hypothetical protein
MAYGPMDDITKNWPRMKNLGRPKLLDNVPKGQRKLAAPHESKLDLTDNLNEQTK